MIGLIYQSSTTLAKYCGKNVCFARLMPQSATLPPNIKVILVY